MCRRADERPARARPALPRARGSRLRASLRSITSLARDWLQRLGASTGRELLRSPRVRSASRELRGDRAGQAAAGALVQLRPAAHDLAWQAGAVVVERLDVRVPDAASRDADLRGHIA